MKTTMDRIDNNNPYKYKIMKTNHQRMMCCIVAALTFFLATAVRG